MEKNLMSGSGLPQQPWIYMPVFVLSSLLCATDARPEADGPNTLYKEDAAKLALYEANDEPAVILAVAARKGRTEQLAKFVQREGGRVDYWLDEIDYLTAIVPRKVVRTVMAHPDVQAAAVDHLNEEYADQAGWMSGGKLDENLSESHDREGDDSSGPPFWPPRPSQRPIEKPYPILRDMDGEAFRALDPRFDGRGVVIAHVEGFPDFLSPELQVARDVVGASLPKFADIVNVPVPQPVLNSVPSTQGPMWTTALSPVVTSDGERLIHQGETYRAPAPGSYRFARFDVPHPSAATWSSSIYSLLKQAYFAEMQSPMGPEVKELGALQFDVLWSDSRRTLWIDTNRDRSFADESGVQEYRYSHRLGVLGTDDPATKVRESIGYAVQFDGNYVSINFGAGNHASMVAGAAAASRGLVGRIEGIAPGAQLISIAAGVAPSISAYVRGLAIAFSDPRTDVVLVEGHSQITMPHGPKDGQSLLAIALGRLVERFGKPTLVTANNVPFMSAVWDYTLPDAVLSIGASQSAASVWAHYGFRTRYPQDLHWLGSEGPAGNGALKPDFLAPANPISLSAATYDGTGLRYPGIFQLPPGYMIGSGTSTAAPVAAGAAALLVGAAKLHNLPRDAEHINDALRETAKFIPEFPAYKQGRGVLQVHAAWQRLASNASGSQCCEIAVEAPVRTVWSHALPQPNVGSGLFEREGWRVGDRGVRVISLTRRTGPSSPVLMDVKWEGNPGIFSSAVSINLPLNEPATLEVQIAPDAPGAYSAVIHVSSAVMSKAISVPVTIVVPYEFDASNSHTWNGAVEIDRPGRKNLFFRIPPNTGAFSVELRASREMVMWLVNPDNPDEIHRGVVLERGRGEARVTVESPAPGLWELVLNDRADSAEFDWTIAPGEYLPRTNVVLKASILSASMELGSAHLVVINKGSEFHGTVPTMALGGRRSQSARLIQGQVLAFDIEVEQGQELLVAQIVYSGGAHLDADLHLFDCTRGRCWSAYRGDKQHANEQVIVERPAAGKWRAMVVGVGAAVGEMELTFADYYAHPRYGALVTTDVVARRQPGETWIAHLHWWRGAEQRPGYDACGIVAIKAENMRQPSVRSYVPDFAARKEGEGRDTILDVMCARSITEGIPRPAAVHGEQ